MLRTRDHALRRDERDLAEERVVGAAARVSTTPVDYMREEGTSMGV